MSQLTMGIGPVRPRTEREKLFDSAVEYMAGFIRQGMTYKQALDALEVSPASEQPRIVLRAGMLGVWIDREFITAFPLERVWSAAERRASEEGS